MKISNRSFGNYAKELAEAMHRQNITQVKYEQDDAENIFEEKETMNQQKKIFINHFLIQQIKDKNYYEHLV